MKVDLIQLIVDDILSLAKFQAKGSSNLVSSIHGVWGDVGNKLGEIMAELNRKERNERNK